MKIFKKQPAGQPKTYSKDELKKIVTETVAKQAKELEEAGRKLEKNLERSFNSKLRSLTLASCRVCGQKILTVDGGWYRDSKGRVFCSHECINKFLEPESPIKRKEG
jgi:hypothetical protein